MFFHFLNSRKLKGIVQKTTVHFRDITDTLEKAQGYRQIKMYSKEKIMWTRYVPQEPNGRFGYGSYHITDSFLVETTE